MFVIRHPVSTRRWRELDDGHLILSISYATYPTEARAHASIERSLAYERKAVREERRKLFEVERIEQDEGQPWIRK